MVLIIVVRLSLLARLLAHFSSSALGCRARRGICAIGMNTCLFALRTIFQISSYIEHAAPALRMVLNYLCEDGGMSLN